MGMGSFLLAGPAPRCVLVEQALPGEGIVLRATAAERLPYAATLCPAGSRPGLPLRMLSPKVPPVVEMRTYRAADPGRIDRRLLAAIFSRAGIQLLACAEQTELTCLTGFEDLTARDRAWTKLSLDSGWAPLRAHIQLARLTLFRYCS